MKANKHHEEARELTYADFPNRWVWKAKEKNGKRESKDMQ